MDSDNPSPNEMQHEMMPQAQSYHPILTVLNIGSFSNICSLRKESVGNWRPLKKGHCRVASFSCLRL
jgi:hypothetical protein